MRPSDGQFWSVDVSRLSQFTEARTSNLFSDDSDLSPVYQTTDLVATDMPNAQTFDKNEAYTSWVSDSPILEALQEDDWLDIAEITEVTEQLDILISLTEDEPTLTSYLQS